MLKRFISLMFASLAIMIVFTSQAHASKDQSLDLMVKHALKDYVHTPQMVYGQDENGKYCFNNKCRLVWSDDATVIVSQNSWRAALTFLRALYKNPASVDPTYLPGVCHRRVEINFPLGPECEAYLRAKQALLTQ